MNTPLFEPLKKIPLGLGNRDGDVFAVKTIDGTCFLVLTAETLHQRQVFCGMGSTFEIEISLAAFDALISDEPKV